MKKSSIIKEYISGCCEAKINYVSGVYWCDKCRHLIGSILNKKTGHEKEAIEIKKEAKNKKIEELLYKISRFYQVQNFSYKQVYNAELIRAVLPVLDEIVNQFHKNIKKKYKMKIHPHTAAHKFLDYLKSLVSEKV